jgi:transposase-like protein
MIGLLGRRSSRRGLAGQRRVREAERLARRSAVACTRWLMRGGASVERAAQWLGLDPRTLAAWLARWRRDRLQIVARGRAPERADRALRHEILALLGVMGAHVSEITLRSLFPSCPRNELHDLVARCRAIVRKRGAFTIRALRWLRPGSVWAIDGTDAPTPVDGLYPKVLAVRDLASGEGLAALPAPAEDGESCAALLEALFIEHGPPLVLKCDNRPGRDGTVLDLLNTWHVIPLVSPPYTPSYNGAVEAGIGALKAEAHFEAARHDRPGQWTCDDLLAARRKANETHRPWGLAEPTPDDAWRRRTRIDPQERLDLYQTVSEYRAEEIRQRGILPMTTLSIDEKQEIDRIAISRALIKLDYLRFKRRRFTPPISRPHMRKIS